MPAATITSKSQIITPKEVRKALSLETGDRVAFLMREDGVAEMQREPVELMSLFGAIKPGVNGVNLQNMDEAIRRPAVRK
jgi:antitoxin PrlF